MSELADFLRARLDEDERAARDHLCIHCGCTTVPLRNVFGVTGYTHDGRMSAGNGQLECEWQGVRCRSRLTGAEPVQNPERVLRYVEAEREILRRCAVHMDEPDQWPNGLVSPRGVLARQVLMNLGEAHHDHPDYRQEWKP